MITDCLDIVILNCNNKGYIERCISSIESHTTGRYNLIVVDQNSGDGTREWLEDNQIAPHIVLNKKNVGVASGRNQGVSVGRGSWIAFIDSDIEIVDNLWLDKMWNYAIDRRIGFIEARVKEGGYAGKWQYGKMSFCLVRRQCFYEVGCFDRNFVIGEDMDWFARFEWSWWKQAFCDETEIIHFGKKTIDGCLGHKKEELEIKSGDLMKMKYSPMFIEEILLNNVSRRGRKDNEL